MDEMERSFDMPMDEDVCSYDEYDELSDQEIDDILGKENTDDAGVGMEIDPTMDPDYDPNVELPEGSDVMYVKNPKTGRWELKKKVTKTVDKKNVSSNEWQMAQERARRQIEYERQLEVERQYLEDVRNSQMFGEVTYANPYTGEVYNNGTLIGGIDENGNAYTTTMGGIELGQTDIEPPLYNETPVQIQQAYEALPEVESSERRYAQMQQEYTRTEREIKTPTPDYNQPQIPEYSQPAYPDQAYETGAPAHDNINIVQGYGDGENSAIVQSADVIVHEGDTVHENVTYNTGLFDDAEIARAESDRAFDRARDIADTGFSSDDPHVAEILASAERIDDAGNVYNAEHEVIAVVDRTGNVYEMNDGTVNTEPVGAYSGSTEWMTQAQGPAPEIHHEQADVQVDKGPIPVPNVEDAWTSHTVNNGPADGEFLTPTDLYNREVAAQGGRVERDPYVEASDPYLDNFIPSRDLDINVIQGSYLQEGEYGEIRDMAHPQDRRDVAEGLSDLIKTTMAGLDQDNAADMARGYEALADTIVDSYSTKVFTDPVVLEGAMKVSNNLRYDAEVTPAQQEKIDAVVNQIKDAYEQNKMKYAMNNREEIETIITQAKASTEKKWEQLDNDYVAHGTQAILKEDASMRNVITEKQARGEALTEVEAGILASKPKTLEEATAQVKATDAYKEHLGKRADYINEGISIAVTERFGRRAGYAEDIAKDLGVNIKHNTVDEKARVMDLGGQTPGFGGANGQGGGSSWGGGSTGAGPNGPMPNGGTPNGGSNGTKGTGSDTIKFTVAGDMYVSRFGDWVTNKALALPKQAWNVAMSQFIATTGQSDTGGDPSLSNVKSGFKAEGNEAKTIAKTLVAKGAFIGQKAIAENAGETALSWINVLNKVSIDPNTGKVLRDGSGLKFDGFNAVKIAVRDKDGTMVTKFVKPTDVLDEVRKDPAFFGITGEKNLKALEKYSSMAGDMINTRKMIAEAIALAPAGTFTKKEIEFFNKNGGLDFLSKADPALAAKMLNKSIMLSHGGTEWGKLIGGAKSSKEMQKIIDLLVKKEKLSNDNPLMTMARAKLALLKQGERKKASRLFKPALGRRIKMLGNYGKQAIGDDAQVGMRQMTSVLGVPGRAVRTVKGTGRFLNTIFRAHAGIQNRFFASKVGQTLRNNSRIFNWLGKHSDNRMAAIARWDNSVLAAKRKIAGAKKKAKDLAKDTAKKGVKATGKFIAKHVPGAGRAGRALVNAAGRGNAIYKRGQAAVKRVFDPFKKAKDAVKKKLRGIYDATLGRIFNPIAAVISGIKRAIRSAIMAVLPYILLALGIIIMGAILLYFLSELILLLSGQLVAYGTTTMDQSKESLTNSLNTVYEIEGDATQEARDVIDGDPAEVDASYKTVISTMDGEEVTIEHFGHKKNFLGDDEESATTVQESSQGYHNELEDLGIFDYDYNNIIYIKPESIEKIEEFAANTGEIDKAEFDQFNFRLRNGLDLETGEQLSAEDAQAYTKNYTTAQEVIAIATAMYGNTKVIMDDTANEAFNALVRDIYNILSPEEAVTAVSAIYANQYSSDKDFIYYCNDKEGNGGRAYGTDDYEDKEYNEYVTGLAEKGGALYDENGMIVGKFYTSDETIPEFSKDDIDMIEWHLDSDERGCEFDWDAYNEAMSDWHDNEPDPDDYDDDSNYESDHDDWEGEEPDKADYYYCPGHEVTICYGNRDAAIYIPQYSYQDFVHDDTFVEKIKASENYDVYKDYIKAFIEAGGFNRGEGNLETMYEMLVESFLSQDWQKVYGVDVDELYTQAFKTGSSSGSSDDPYNLNNPGAVSVTEAEGTRAEVSEAARALKGRISYYYGGKAAYVDFDKNGFGKIVAADTKGRNKRGLDCSGYVDFAFAQLGIGCNGKKEPGEKGAVVNKDGTINQAYTICRGMGTGGVGYLPEYRNANKLKVGDIGMHSSYSAKSQGANNHIGIFLGFTESGGQLWAACGSHGVSVYETKEFVVYYDTSQLFTK